MQHSAICELHWARKRRISKPAERFTSQIGTGIPRNCICQAKNQPEDI